MALLLKQAREEIEMQEKYNGRIKYTIKQQPAKYTDFSDQRNQWNPERNA